MKKSSVVLIFLFAFTIIIFNSRKTYLANNGTGLTNTNALTVDVDKEMSKLNQVNYTNVFENQENNKEHISSKNFSKNETFAEKITYSAAIFKEEFPLYNIIGIRWEATANPDTICYVFEGLNHSNIVTVKYTFGIDEDNNELFIKKLGSENRELYEIERNKDGSSVKKEVRINNYISYENLFSIVEGIEGLKEYRVHNWDLLQYETAAIFRIFLESDLKGSKIITINAETGEVFD